MDERKTEEQKYSSTTDEGQQEQQNTPVQSYNAEQGYNELPLQQDMPPNSAGNTQQYYAQPTQQTMYGGGYITPQYQNGAYYYAAPAQLTEAQKQEQKKAELLESIERFGFGEVWKREHPNEYSMYLKIKILQYVLIAIGIILGAIAVISFFSWQNSDSLEKLLNYKDTKNTVNALIISCACILFIGVSLIPSNFKIAKISNFIYAIKLDYKGILTRGYNAKLNSTQFKEIKKYAYLQHTGKLNKNNIFIDYCLCIVIFAVVFSFVGYIAYDYVNTDMYNWIFSVEESAFISDFISSDMTSYIILAIFIVIIVTIFVIIGSRNKKIDKWVESLM